MAVANIPLWNNIRYGRWRSARESDVDAAIEKFLLGWCPKVIETTDYSHRDAFSRVEICDSILQIPANTVAKKSNFLCN